MYKLALAGFLLFSIGCGVNRIEKTPFSGVISFENKGNLLVAFDDVAYDKLSVVLYEKKEIRLFKVFVDLDDVEVNVDSSLPGIALTVTPFFSNRLFSPLLNVISASKVTIWVQGEDEKNKWEEWLLSEQQRWVQERFRKLNYKKINPPLPRNE